MLVRREQTRLHAPPSPDNPLKGTDLTTETVEGTALALEGVDDVERRDRLALGVLGVGDGVADDALEEGLEDTAGLLVDHWQNNVRTFSQSCQLRWSPKLTG